MHLRYLFGNRNTVYSWLQSDRGHGSVPENICFMKVGQIVATVQRTILLSCTTPMLYVCQGHHCPWWQQKVQALERVRFETGSCACLVLPMHTLQTALSIPYEAVAGRWQGDTGYIVNDASVNLARIRSQLQANWVELEELSGQWAAQCHQKGFAERPTIVVRRGRKCVPIKAGCQGQLPRWGAKGLCLRFVSCLWCLCSKDTPYFRPIDPSHNDENWCIEIWKCVQF